ncbi:MULTISPECIES: lanthionine synthetase LanC family protein [unclassified Janthinobacterium]|uniref:lanthionine synthetase LanC family protein n=1 Tax=unclassified Janthinobacterium TaxID=2610881 RepID=UPI0003479EAC|nr:MULTISPECIES: lanthionine synthetase LanC family protein [unclassified Janthinobacterium]MEC5160715.1 hypothetical protein [Janthinobacterium sp. CG_S6]
MTLPMPMPRPPQALRQHLMRSVLARLAASVAGAWDNPSYASGAAGHLLAMAVLAERCPHARLDVALMEDCVQRLLGAIPQLEHGLYQGAEGVMYAALELDRHFGFGLAQDAACDFDDYLHDCLRHERDLPYRFDLISGISGLAVYAGYRARQGADPAALHAALDRLGAMASRDERGASWFTPPAWVHGLPMGQAYPLGCVDMGVAHGQAGVLATLGYALAGMPAPHAGARALLTEALAFLRHHEHTGQKSHFGVVAGDADAARCAWCYGDLGMAGALRLAAAALAAPALDDWADRLLHSMRRRPLGELGFVDPWLCHGSAGAGWLLRQLGGDSADLADMAAACDALHLHEDAGGVVARLEQAPQLSLLEGMAGVALACAHVDGRPPALHWSLPLLAGRNALAPPIHPR